MVAAGLVLAVAGTAAGVAAGFAGALAPFAVPVVGVAPPVVPLVVAAGVAGNEVNGVGSGGSGFERMLATSVSTPVSGSFGLRNLYHCFRLSFHVAF